MKSRSFYIIAGEASGDLHGGALICALKSLEPTLCFKGIGGPAMENEGLKALLPFSDFAVMGFTDVIWALPRLWKHFYYLAKDILNENPPCVIFIDYPGFNLRLAKHLRKNGYTGKLIHYIAPSVWAWKKNRIHTMAKTLDLLLTIFPFEAAHFACTTLNVKYAGNPLVQTVPFTQTPRQNKLALFPGSRPKEITRNFPVQLAAAELFLQEYPHFTLEASLSDPSHLPLLHQIMHKSSVKCTLIPETRRYQLMQEAQVALAKSGTVTLELALSACPTVVTYRLTRLNYFLARYLFRINLPFYALPNILLQEHLFPEWYAVDLDPKALCLSLKEQLAKRAYIAEKSNTLRALLQNQDAAAFSAAEILKLC